MANIIKIILFIAFAYGLYWVANNVDFNALINDSTQQIKKEKTITRVLKGRQRDIENTKRIAE